MKKRKLNRCYEALEGVSQKIGAGERLDTSDVALLCVNAYLRYGNTHGLKIQFSKRIDDLVFLLKYSRKLYNPSLHALIRVLEENGFVEDGTRWIPVDKTFSRGTSEIDLIYNGGKSGFCVEYISDDELHLVSEIQSYLRQKAAQKKTRPPNSPQACAQWEDVRAQSIADPE